MLLEHREDRVSAIRLIRESTVNPPEHGLLLVHDVAGCLQLISEHDVPWAERARMLAAWQTNDVPAMSPQN